MTDFSLWFLVIANVLTAFLLLMIGLSVIPWCARQFTSTVHSTNSWNHIQTIAAHDSLTTSLPPLPPYFFGSEVKFVESV